MPSLRTPLLVIAAVTAVVGGGAWAATNYTHHINVTLPDGSIAQVDYVGDTAPRVVLRPISTVPISKVPVSTVPVSTVPVAAQNPVFAIAFSGFAQMDRIVADMQRQQQVMMQRAAAMQRAMVAHPVAVMASAGQHGASFSYVSTTTSNNGCTQTVQWSSNGTARSAQAEPKVIRTSSGNCDKAVQHTPVHPAADVKPRQPALPGKPV